jgi:hypothetical protein
VITVRGESPLKYFSTPPTVRVLAGSQQLAVLRPTSDFSWRLQVPETVLANSDGTVTIETDKIYQRDKPKARRTRDDSVSACSRWGWSRPEIEPVVKIVKTRPGLVFESKNQTRSGFYLNGTRAVTPFPSSIVTI